MHPKHTEYSHITESLFPRFLNPSTFFCNQASSLSKPLCQHCVNLPCPNKVYYCCFPKSNFFDNSKKSKTKVISKNSILFKPKCNFKNKNVLLFGIIFVLYCCFLQRIRLESGPIRNMFKFPDLSFWFQLSYCFFIFHCIIFAFFT